MEASLKRRLLLAGGLALGALAAWVWAGRREYKDAWLRRAMVSTGLVLAWFIPWYLRRYLGLYWPVVDLFKTLGLGFASAVLYIFWDWARSARKKPPQSEPSEAEVP